MPNKLQHLLAYVPFSEESWTGDFDGNTQDVFERVFMLRDRFVQDAVRKFQEAIPCNFREIDIFCRAISCKLIEQYRLSQIEMQILYLCVNRFVYPFVYLGAPQFFPKQISKRSRSDFITPSIEPAIFKRAVSSLNAVPFIIAPSDMIHELNSASSIIVDGSLVKFSVNDRPDFGAQELLPILEAVVASADSPLLLGIFHWLDQFCQDVSFTASSSYVVTCFLTVADSALEFMT